jgi:hypothetical protein
MIVEVDLAHEEETASVSVQFVEQFKRYFARHIVYAVQIDDLRVLFPAGKGNIDQAVVLFLHMYRHLRLLSRVDVWDREKQPRGRDYPPSPRRRSATAKNIRVGLPQAPVSLRFLRTIIPEKARK